MIVETRAGEVRQAPGTLGELRIGPYRSLIVSDAHAKYFEAGRNGRVFSASTAAAIALGTATPLGAGGTAPFALLNPAGSNKVAAILKATVHQFLGATPVGNLPVWNFIPTPSGITAAGNITPVCSRLDLSASTMRCFGATALTGSVAATLLRPFGAATSATQTGTLASGDYGAITEETDGAILVTPGAAIAIVFSAAGTNVTGQIGVIWEELDWPL